MTKPILPGSTIGVLGSGQLGRMFTLAARRMGYRVHTFSPDRDTPTGQVADKEWTASYTNKRKLQSFAKKVDVITYEFENIPIETINFLSRFVPTRPKGKLLHIAQNRIREKDYLSRIGIPVAPYRPIRKMKDAEAAKKDLKFPFIIKTADFGYDGKGQKKIPSEKSFRDYMKSYRGNDLIVEKLIRFSKEVSVVGARSISGEFTHFGVIENQHKNHILDVSFSPAKVSKAVKNKAIKLTQSIMKSLDVVGVLCVEMFLTKSGKLLVNELAPRPHNSGHLTLDGFSTNQFEQQVRAICGLPLAHVQQWAPTAMVNILGDLWSNGDPKWIKSFKNSKAKLHLYGKAHARPGRKMGHLTATGDSVSSAVHLVRKIRSRIQN